MTLIDPRVWNLFRNLSEQERMQFSVHYWNGHKDFAMAFWLCFNLGAVGGHWFYLGKAREGVLCLLFFWTFIPAIIAFCNLFTMKERIRSYNLALAKDIIDDMTNPHA